MSDKQQQFTVDLDIPHDAAERVARQDAYTARHTPGPWRVDAPRTSSRRVFMPNDTVEIRAPNGGTVACLYAENFHGADEANANVLAAAPELLAVAKGYEAWEADLILNNGWNGKDGLPTLTTAQYDELMRLQSMRNAAIAKATGQPSTTEAA